jgi:hypothetical protein
MGKTLLQELDKKDLSTHLYREGEALSHLLYHQFFILGLKKEDIKLNIKKVERNNIFWNLYQLEILLPSHLKAKEVIASLEHEVESSYPSLSLKSRMLNNGAYELIIKENNLAVCQLTFILPPQEGFPPVESRTNVAGRIAIVIDDLGPSLAIAREFLSLQYTLTFSILPFYPHSKEISIEAHAQGREVMLHLPLEPLNDEDYKPEKGILYTALAEATLLKQLQEDISAIPHVSGVNGHMGSKFTGDRKSMRIVLGELKKQGLFFLDSLTTGKSVGSSVAGETGTAYGRRDLFLDRDLEGKTIEERLLQLAELSKKRGYAIGIVHPYSDTLNALKKILPVLASQGIEVVPVSQVINHSAQKP